MGDEPLAHTSRTLIEADLQHAQTLLRQAWEASPPADVGAFLPRDPALRRRALWALIPIDLECRSRMEPSLETISGTLTTSGLETPDTQLPRLEQYLSRFPELGGVADLPLELVAAEFRARACRGLAPDEAELSERFPHLASVLPKAMAEWTRERSPQPDEPTGPEVVAGHPPSFGRYRVVRTLGEGGFGVVYEGFDPLLDRAVAIKVPRPDRLASLTDVDAWLAEARTVASLDHPGIVAVYDVGRTEGGACFVVSRYIARGSLAASRGSVRSSPLEAAEMVAHLAEALEYAHRRGVVHRDVKPANILLDASGRALLADFGLALTEKAYARGPKLCGTPAYMSPEQARGAGHRVDARSDIFSLGVVFYELLTGRRPWRTLRSEELLGEIAESDVRPPRQLDPEIPRELERICLRATARNVNERYTTAADLAEDLTQWLLLQPRPTLAQQESRTKSPSELATGGGAGTMPSGTSSDARRHNLPKQPTSFIGREQELAEVKQLLATTSLLTLAGAGGSGKTRLSQRVAEELLPEYPDGVWLVELASLTDAALVAQAVSQQVGVREGGGQSARDALAAFLANRRLLLLLDNCEHLVDACAELAEQLITRCPGVRILATSREPLRVAGEVVWRIPTLPLPDAPIDDPMALATHPAVRLFCERAAACRASFALTPENGGAIAEICRQLDGMPLAIELAAARVTALSPAQILERLNDRFRLLTSGRRATLPRQQTLEAAIAWSHELLSQDERELFARLSVFAGEFQLGAVEAVCAGERLDAASILDLVAQLAEKSLLVTSTDTRGEIRYRMLETIRAYAAARLSETGGADALARRHLDYYQQLCQAASVILEEGGAQLAWVARLDRELDNLRAALAFAAGRALDRLPRYADALARYFDDRFFFTETQQMVQRALAVAQSEPPELRANLLRWCARVADHLGDWRESERLAAESVALAESCGYQVGVCRALSNLAVAAWRAGDYARATAHSQRAYELGQKLGQTFLMSTALNNLAIVAGDSGDLPRQRECLEAGLALDRASHNTLSLQFKLYNLGIAAARLGDFAQALLLFEEATLLSRELGNRRLRAMGCYMLGWMELKRGDAERAQRFAEESRRMSRDAGDRCEESWAVMVLGHVALARNDRPKARALYQESLRARDALGYRFGYAMLIEALAQLDADDRDPSRAVLLLGAAAAIREAVRAPMFPCDQPDHERLLARLRDQLGEAMFTALWDRGAAMPMDQAVTLAAGDSRA